MAYTETKYVNVTTGNDTTSDGSISNPYKTIDYCKTKLTTTAPLVYISEGTHIVNNLAGMSLSGKTVTYIGKNEKTILEFSNRGLDFLGIMNLNNCILRPSNSLGGNTGYLNYSNDSFQINFNNCLFRKSLNGTYPTFYYFSFDNSATLYMNKIFNNCTFELIVNSVNPTNEAYKCVTTKYGRYNNCATATKYYNQGGLLTSYDTTSFVNAVYDTNFKLTNGDNSLYGVYSGVNAWIDNYYFIKQNNNYYTMKVGNYDDVTTHNFIPLTLTGGALPNKSDIETMGFNNLSLLTNNMVVGSDSFIPLSKLDNNFEIKCYKPN